MELGTLDDQEWHHALQMLTLETSHAERERKNTPTKQHQDKDWATKTKQDLPVNMTIDNRLLACNASWDKLYNKAKPALRVSPYFQVLALDYHN
jgi:ribosomal protein L11 methylase PrmA